MLSGLLAMPGRGLAQNVSTATAGEGGYVTVGTSAPRRDDPQAIERYVGKQIDRARSFMRDDKPGQARKALDAIDNLPGTDAQIAEVKAIVADLNAIGEGWLAQADALYRQGEYPQAIDLLEKVNRYFATLACGAKARRGLETAENDPKCQAALVEIQAEALEEQLDAIFLHDRRRRQHRQTRDAGAVTSQSSPESPAGGDDVLSSLRPADGAVPSAEPDETQASPKPAADARVKALALLPPEKQLRAMALLEQIVQRFGQTQAAARARADLQTLRAEKDLMATLDAYRQKRKVAAAFNRAMMYYRGGMNDQAVAYLEAFLKDYPDASQVAEARKVLRNIELKSHAPQAD